ncbi:MAG: hypothetical protein HRU11_04735 [Parvularculaceae bacterium]|nr:hypothetical protein [Parvularculaceae bacterium]
MFARRRLLSGMVALLAIAGARPALAEEAVSITIDDFRMIEGETWSDDLNYLDYTSGERTSIPIRAQFEVADANTLLYAIQYPGEEQHNNKTAMKLSQDGEFFDGARVSGRTATGSMVTITTLSRGRDDNQPADIQIVYEISADVFKMKKNVRFDDGDAFFNRNVYTFRRQ